MHVIDQARIGLEWLRIMEAASAEIANPFKRWWFRLGLHRASASPSISSNTRRLSMLASDYQRAALTTSGGASLSPEMRLAVAALGLTGEAGEVADLLKKHLGHGHDLDRVQVQKEIGDVCWYIAELCNCLSLRLDVVLANNLAKLQRRYPQGFSTSASINREE